MKSELQKSQVIALHSLNDEFEGFRRQDIVSISLLVSLKKELFHDGFRIVADIGHDPRDLICHVAHKGSLIIGHAQLELAEDMLTAVL